MGAEPGSEGVTLLDLLLSEHFAYAKPTGSVKVERVLGKSVATQVRADYPLQFMIPKKVNAFSVCMPRDAEKASFAFGFWSFM